MPFSLVYRCEAVLPLKIPIPSLRIVIASSMTEEEKDKQRLAQLEELNEKRLKAQQQIELYQARIARAYNKGIKLWTFEEGELVLAVRRPTKTAHKSRGKFQPKWEGPFIVETVYSNGAYRLVTMEVNAVMMPINGKYLKKYYAWLYLPFLEEITFMIWGMIICGMIYTQTPRPKYEWVQAI